MRTASFILSLLLGCFTAVHAETSVVTEQTVTIVTGAGVSASVTFEGDYGPNRLEGTLVSIPTEPIKAREGKAIKEIAIRHLQELQRTPLGVGPDALSTYQLALFSGESFILQPDKSEPAGAQPAAVTRVLQVVSVPKDALVLKTELFGPVRIPFPKLLQLTVQPIRGTVREAPSVPLSLQVLPGLTFSVPFRKVTNLRRDPLGGTATVSFGIAEGITGRILAMPAGVVMLRMADGEERSIALADIVQYVVEGTSTTTVASNPTK